MADYTHTIDRWDEATGEQIAANFSRTPSLQPRADHHFGNNTYSAHCAATGSRSCHLSLTKFDPTTRMLYVSRPYFVSFVITTTLPIFACSKVPLMRSNLI